MYDIIVVGAGHAGCEASLSAARMGLKVLVVTMQKDTIAQMSCNPAIGGLAKGQIVREIDALGGEMAKIIDKTGIQFRMLNTKKGYAVRSPRAQADRNAYQVAMRQVLESQSNIDIIEDVIEKIKVKKGKVSEVIGQQGQTYQAKAVIITTGTFLNGLLHIGLNSFEGGRIGEKAAQGLSQALKEIGFELGRLKTGTSPRIDKITVDTSNLRRQDGDNPPTPFSFTTQRIDRKQIPCYLTYTNQITHDIIRNNLDQSPLYAGKITGTGVRYCPSIEDKIVRFVERNRHQIFIEPEGETSDILYLNGISTSLPMDVQEKIINTIPGLEKAKILQYGYGVEYDFASPTQLKPTLETKLIENLYFAGQINGTSGYEEAAAQGIMAGINAVLKLRRQEPFILKRSEAYIGVLIDDLVTKGTQEPYRMFTSRAEYRLILRHDNADLRLMHYGHKLGLISDAQYNDLLNKKKQIEDEIYRLNHTFSKEDGVTLAQLLKRGQPIEIFYPQLTRDKGLPITDYSLSLAGEGKGVEMQSLPPQVIEQVEIEIKYEGYIKRQMTQLLQFKRMEDWKIPADFDYYTLTGLSNETKDKLSKIRPVSLGQASRISGIRPADISILMVWLGKGVKDSANTL